MPIRRRTERWRSGIRGLAFSLFGTSPPQLSRYSIGSRSLAQRRRSRGVGDCCQDLGGAAGHWGLIRARDSFSSCPLHGSVKGSAEPLVSGWRSLVIERVIGRSDAQSPNRCSCASGSCFAKAPAGKLPPRSSTAGPIRAAVDTPSCVDLGVNMYLFRARPRTAHDTDIPPSPFNSAAAIGWINLI
jgi:hypothetical protein